MKKVMIYSLLLISCLIFLMWIGSPWWTLYQINQAIEQRQSEKISAYIDFPAVRTHLKPQIEQRMHQQLGFATGSTYVDQLANRTAVQLTDKVVDKVVTPQSIALLMQGLQLNDLLESATAVEIAGFQVQASQLMQWVQEMNQSQPELQHDQQQTTAPAEVLSPDAWTATDTTLLPEKLSSLGHYVGLNQFQLVIPLKLTGQTGFLFQRKGFWQWQLVNIQLQERR